MGLAHGEHFELDDAWAMAFCIILGEFEGNVWNWRTLGWEDTKT